MKNLFVFILIIFTWSLSVYSQMGGQGQLMISRDDRIITVSSSHRFKDIFERFEVTGIYLAGTEVLQKNHVKTLEVHASDGGFMYKASLDRSGKLLYEEYPLKESLLKIRYLYGKEGLELVVKTYLVDSVVCMIDSGYYTYIRQTRNDTSRSFARVTESRYKTGNLLNKQNSYYNSRYLNKKLVIREDYLQAPGQTNSPKVYLDKELKQDYNNDQYYLCAVTRRDESLKIMQNNTPYPAAAGDLQDPFWRAFKPMPVTEYFDSGENFQEPVSMHENFICGTGLMEMQEYRRSHTYGFDTLANGLYNLYYVQSEGGEKYPMYRVQYEYFK